ncbi:MAG: fumarylacetoacetate hydrolase family protein [Mesorhizobium sp.]|nr:fumarylacetoacetate hydrolase family protein [Mesorhizobium sp.]
MKLATLSNGTRDGRLVVVSRDLARCRDASAIAATMQIALESWDASQPRLAALARELEADTSTGDPFNPHDAMAPLPRAYQWLDGSAFLNHGRLMQKAFGLAPIGEDLPLVYQGAGDDFLGPRAPIVCASEDHGIDFEGEVGVVFGDVPMGASPEGALSQVRLIVQINDVSLRAHAPREMKTGFGFVLAKPSSAFAPVAVTPDELGGSWRDGRVALPLEIAWNEAWFGAPNGAEMDFSFGEIAAHVLQTRRFTAGAILGSGTISNRDRAAGSACIAERRAIELADTGAAKTGFMRFGDRVRMEMRCADGSPLFGAIEQVVQRYEARTPAP